MYVYILAICAATLYAFSAAAQAEPSYKVQFKNGTETVTKSKAEDKLLTIEVEADSLARTLKTYELDIAVNYDKATFPKNQYEIISTVSGKALSDLKENKNYIRILIKKSDKKDQALTLYLAISVKKKKGDELVADSDENNKGVNKELEIAVNAAEIPLENYRYLGYLGTNFDLVDGIQPKKLFFATNILIPEANRWGLNVGIYGNRTMTQTDSAHNVSFTSRIMAVNSDSIAYHRDSAMKITTNVSDNIGAYFSPLFPVRCLSDGNLKFYFAPVIEFIWRRTMIEDEYISNATYRIDTVPNRFPSGVNLPLVTPLKNKINLNIYDVYLGVLGIMLRYENEDISIRITSSVGWNYNYVPVSAGNSNNTLNNNFRKQERKFYFGRLWITEPTTGFTLGAEISNYFGSTIVNNEKRSKGQPYYNVTLSKAFNLKNLAAIVKPLTNK